MAFELTVVLRFENEGDITGFLEDVEDDFECTVVEHDTEEV